MHALHIAICHDDCHQLLPAAMMRVAATLPVTVWIVCSDRPHPIVCTEKAACALAAATCLVKIFVVW